MRQVMPHRNNIGADRLTCKSFLHGKLGYPLNSGDCGIPVRIPRRAVGEGSPCNINDLERYSADQQRHSHHNRR